MKVHFLLGFILLVMTNSRVCGQDVFEAREELNDRIDVMQETINDTRGTEQEDSKGAKLAQDFIKDDMNSIDLLEKE